MKKLREHLQDYLTLRRKCGFKLRVQGGLLAQFVRFAEASRAAFVTTQLALEWATQPEEAQPAQWANRLGMVRGFAKYLSAVDPRSEIPPQGLLPHSFRRKTPYHYRDQEVVDLIAKAKELPSPKGLRGETFSILFGLLAVTGMRVGEAVHLECECVDLEQAVITIRHAKGERTRVVAIHPSTCRVLRDYEKLRNRLFPHPASSRFFLSEEGNRLTERVVAFWFVRVSRQTGLRGPNDSRGPRLHDLRHRFATRTLLRWYRTGKDVEAHLPELATYLGHRSVTDTYWYLSAVPELLRQAARRCERTKGGARL
jgi:integrase/recombinase XerD